jgi:hypothetical protein
MTSGRRKFVALGMLFALVSYSTLLRRATSGYDISFKEDQLILPQSEHPHHQHYANTSTLVQDSMQKHVPQQSNLSSTDRTGDINYYDEEIDMDDPLADQVQDITEYWWQNSKTCFGVHNICRSSKNRWFYFHQRTNSSKLFQPSFSLKYVPYSYRRGLFADIRVKMSVNFSSVLSWEELMPSGSEKCDISSVDQHVVLHALHNVSCRLVLYFFLCCTQID